MSEKYISLYISDDQYALIKVLLQQIGHGYHLSDGYRDEFPSGKTRDIAKRAYEKFSIKTDNQDIFFSRDIKNDILGKYVKIKVYDKNATVLYDGQLDELKSYTKQEQEFFDITIAGHTITELTEHDLVQAYYGKEVMINLNHRARLTEKKVS